MSVKDLFKRSHSVIASASLETMGAEVESADYFEPYIKDQDRLEPHVDFSDPANFVKYGSAEQYYDTAIKWIWGNYPYDGSLKEKLEWRNQSTLLDLYIYDVRYPKTTGYATFAPTRWGTHTGSLYSGYGAPASSDYEYINLKGGPGTPYGQSIGTASLKGVFDSKANVWDADVTGSGTRESNLKTNLSGGVTVEFWLKTGSLNTSTQTAKQVVFDMWNNQVSSSTDYGRLRIELDGATSASSGEATSIFRVTLMSGAAGLGRTTLDDSGSSGLPVGTNIDLNSLSSWKHYAFSFVNKDNQIQTKFYVDGTLSETITTGSSINEIREPLEANIGALLSGTYNTTWTAAGVGSPAHGWGKLSGSIDEFRFWKTKRSSKDIKRNWFTSNIGGGTNTDFANTALGVYYKFNEGITDKLPTDKIVLDYSGRITNGTWTGYETGSAGEPWLASRNTGSAIVSASAGVEDLDPIIRANHPLIGALTTELIASGTVYDYTNNSSMFYSMPSWIIEEDEGHDGTTGDLKRLTQILGSHFDNLDLQIGELSKLNMASYPSSSADLKMFKPYPYMYRAVQSHGLESPELFSDSSLLEYFRNRNETKEFEEDLQTVKNLIYGNIYNNLSAIYKSKGTEKSIRNLIRCFGVDNDVVRLNVYADNSTYKFEPKRRFASHKTKAVDFNSVDRFQSTIYQYQDASNANSVGYISGSATGKANAGSIDAFQFEDGFPITVEAEVILPKKASMDFDVGRSQAFNFLTSSLYGLHTPAITSSATTHTTTTNLTWATGDPANFQVFAIRDSLHSKDVKFSLSSSALLPNHPGISSSYFLDVYDDQKWNLAVRLKPHGYPQSFSTGALANDYTLEFYGVNYIADRKVNEFIATASVTKATAENFLANPKRLYAGAHITNFTGAALQYSDAKIVSLRYWMNYLDNTVIQDHAMDPSNFGAGRPDRSAYLLHSDLGTFTSSNGIVSASVEVPQIETLALYWDFETLTGSDNGSGSPTTFDGKFTIQDVSSGSTALAKRYDWLGKILKYQHTGRGNFFPINNTSSIDTVYLYAGKQQLPETVFGDDNIRVLSQAETEVFTKETRPTKTYYAFEKSMYQVISDEIINYFSSIREFNNLVGNPVNRYRQEYKDIKYLRQFFFERIRNTPDLDKFIDYYKWLDSTLEAMLMQLVPASAQTSDGIDNIVESHILERNKYWNKFALIETVTATEGGAKGINNLLYNWRTGHRPLGGLEADNCPYWFHRAERDTAPLSSSDGATDWQAVNTDRNRILSASLQVLERQWTTPFKYTVDRAKNIHGGINYSDNKKYYYFRGVNMPHGEVTEADCGLSGVPKNVINAWNIDVRPLKVCLDPYLEPNPNIKTKYSFGTNNGREQLDGLHDTVKGAIAMPFNIYSASQGLGGYNETVQAEFLTGSQLVNLHNDGYGVLNEVPMQGPFAEKYVGGHQARHIRINRYADPTLVGGDGATTPNNLDGLYSRPESWRLLFGGGPECGGAGAIGLTGPDYGGPYPDSTKYRAWWFREETAKRPVNIRNILQTTASVDVPLSGVLQHGPIGNYEKSYQVVQTSGRSTNNPWFNDGQTELLPARYANDLPKTTNVHTLVAVRDAEFDSHGRGNTFIPGTTPAATDAAAAEQGALRRLSSRYSPYNVVAAHEGRQTVFNLPTRTKQDTVIVERFSAPGGPEINSLGFLDIAAAEKSVYNALPYRNLTVRGSGSGEASGSGGDTMRLEDQTGNRRGLQTLLSLHCGQFGSDATHGVIKEHRGDGDYLSASFHKVNRNALLRPEAAVAEAAAGDPGGRSLEAVTNISASLYDNWYVQHPIPQNDFQYMWISASLSGTGNFRAATGYAPRSGLVSGTNSFHSAISFLTASEALAVLDGANCVFGTIERKTAATALTHIPVDFVGLNTIVYDPIGVQFNYLGGAAALEGAVSSSTDYLNKSICIAGYTENGEVDMFNAIMLHRNGPYGYPTWKQIRTGESSIVRAMRANNTSSIIDPATLPENLSGLHFYNWRSMKSHDSTVSYSSTGGQIWSIENIFGADGNWIASQDREVLTYPEPVVITKYQPLFINAKTSTEGAWVNTNIKATYGNYKSYFSNLPLNDKLSLNEHGDTPADRILTGLHVGTIPSVLNYVVYTENVFPTSINKHKKHTRGRPTFDCPFWRNDRRDRVTKDGGPVYDGRAFSQKNSQGFPILTSSMWPLDARAAFHQTYESAADPQTPTSILTSFFPSYPSCGELQSHEATVFNKAGGGLDGGASNPTACTAGESTTRGAAFITASALYARRHLLPTGSSAVSPSSGITGSYWRDTVFGSGDAPWDTGLQSGKSPFYNSYDEYAEYLHKIAKGGSILPEYRMSERIDDYLINGVDPFKDTAMFSLTGALANHTSSQEANFAKTYSNSEFQKYFDVLQTSLKVEASAKARQISVTCHGAKKLLPYEGFHPVLRSVQLASLFSQSYGANVLLTGSGPRGVPASRWRAFLSPMFAPGIFFNSIKSGIAVDYPLMLGDVSLGTGSSFGYGSAGYQSTSKNHFLSHCTRSADSDMNPDNVFSERLPFEALVDPESYYANKSIIDLETHPSATVNMTASWDGSGDDRYKLAMHNFLAEVPDFYLKDGTLPAFFSQPEDTWKSNTAKFDPDKCYQMAVKIRKSFEYNTDAFINQGGAGASYGSLFPRGFGDVPQIVSGTETICMYSRPTAFGPPSDAGSLTKTGTTSAYSNIISYGINQENYWFGGGSMLGYNAPFTPCYYDGSAWCILEWNPSPGATQVPDLNTLMSELTASYIRYKGWQPSGSVAGGGFQVGENINTNANQVSSSINLFGTSKGLADILKYTGVNLQDSENRWVIQAKWATPILNFIDCSEQAGALLTDVRNATADGELNCKGGRHTRSIGMWHQYGRLPKGKEGIWLEISDHSGSLTPARQNEIYHADATGSLADLVGFPKTSIKMGQVAPSKVIREAVVAIPYVQTDTAKDGSTIFFNEKKLFTLPANDIQAALTPGKGTTQSVQSMVDAMQRYVFPPSLDFITYPDSVRPFTMYIFEFEHKLDQEDLVDMWQNLLPKIGRSFEKNGPDRVGTEQVIQSHTITHRLNMGELLSSTQDNLRWMVFKVKQRAQRNYFRKVAATNSEIVPSIQYGSLLGALSPLGQALPSIIAGGAAKGAAQKTDEANLTYNWPYDFFSLVELVSLDSSFTFEVNSKAAKAAELAKGKK